MTPIMSFVINRIGILFSLVFLFLFNVHSGKRSRVVLQLAIGYVLTSVLAFARSFGGPDSPWMFILCTLLEIVVLIGVSLQSSRYKDFRAVLTTFMALTYSLAGEAPARIVIGFTGDMVIACVIEIAMLVLGIGAFYALCSNDFIEALTENQTKWIRMSIIPALFYIAISGLTVWPNDITQNTDTTYGVIVSLISIFYTAITIVVVFTTGKRTTIQKENLRFLSGYADRIDAKLNNLLSEYGSISDINKELLTVASNLKLAISDEDYDRLLEEITKLENMANRQVERFFTDKHAINAAIMEVDDMARDLGVRLFVDCDIPVNMNNMEEEYATILRSLLGKAIRESAAAGGFTVTTEIYLSGSEVALNVVFPVYLPPDTYHDSKEFALSFVEEFNREFEKPIIRSFIERYKAYFGVRVKGSYLVVDMYVGVQE